MEIINFIRGYPKKARISILICISLLSILLFFNYPKTEIQLSTRKNFIEKLSKYPYWVQYTSGSLIVVCFGILVLSNHNLQKSFEDKKLFIRSSNQKITESEIYLLTDFTDKINFDIRNSKDVVIASNWLPQWIINKSFIEALRNRANIKLNFLDQNSSVLVKRSLDFKNERNYGKEQLQAGLKRLLNIKNKVDKETIEARLSVSFFDSFPSCLIIKCDTKYYFGMYLLGENISENFIFMVKNPESVIAKALEKEVTQIISISKPINF